MFFFTWTANGKSIAAIGRVEVSSCSKNPPFCIKSLFLAECPTSLSASRRSANLSFFSLRFRQVDSGMFPTNIFKTHSFILIISSLLHFEIIALLNFGFAFFRTCSVIVFPYPLYHHLTQHI